MPGRESTSTVSGGRFLTRRAVLIGGAATATVAALGGLLVEEGVLPGRHRLERLLGQAPPAGSVPDVEPGPSIDGTFDSKARGQPTGWAVSYPPGSSVGSALPVLISLHGKGGDHTSSFDLLGLDRFLADHVGTGGTPFAIAAVDAGDTYYHPRDDGSDSGAMVADELVPLLAERGLDTTRLGLLGVSMGGYGSLYLTASGQVRPRAVGTLSAALWTQYEDSAPGAFDDAADFAEHDVFRMRPRLAGVPLRMDCGTDDPFIDANREFVAGVEPAPAGAFEPGAHAVDYWTRLIPDHLDFIGRHLTA